MDKRYQVFVSSTYADLMQERQKVIQALMEMDCIPAGMEIFPAADEEQWEFIKRVVDDCDYYIVIIGGRYGTLTPEGISYTEKEYDYAISIGLKVLAFVHESPEDIPVAKSDIEPYLREKLAEFRDKVCQGRLVKFWKRAEELPGLVALSLSKTIKIYPAIGWVRADNVSNDELLSDINALRKSNDNLRSALIKLQEDTAEPEPELATLDDMVEVTINWKDYEDGRYRPKTKKQSISWSELFARIAPDLMQNPSDDTANSKLGSALYRCLHPGSEKSVQVDHDDFQTVKIQLIALKLIIVSYTKTTTGGMALFWNLTERGQNLMVKLRSIKKTKMAITSVD
jgi:Domain of unknown function (DUF4062)